MAINCNSKVINNFERFSYNWHVLKILPLTSQQNQPSFLVCLLFGQLASAESDAINCIDFSITVVANWYKVVCSHLYGTIIMIDINRQTLIMKK